MEVLNQDEIPSLNMLFSMRKKILNELAQFDYSFIQDTSLPLNLAASSSRSVGSDTYINHS